MTRTLLTAIPHVCGPKFGGLTELWLLESDHVLALPIPVAGSHASGAVLRPGTAFRAIAFDDGSASYAEEAQDDENHGTYWAQRLEFSIAKHRAPLILADWVLRNQYVAAIFTDANGLTRIAPKLRILPASQTGTSPGEVNSFSLVATAQSRRPAFAYDPTAAIDLNHLEFNLLNLP